MKKSPNATDKHVGARVRMRRMMLGLSQEGLGDKLGLTFQQVQKYEKGINRIGASRLQQLSQILGTNVSFFFEGAPNGGNGAVEPIPDFLSAFLATSDGIAIARAFGQIADAKIRHRIVALAEQIAESAQPVQRRVAA